MKRCLIEGCGGTLVKDKLNDDLYRCHICRCTVRLVPGLMPLEQEFKPKPPKSPPTAMDLATPVAIPMLLWCPGCGERHTDEGEFATKPHHTHACQYCGVVWRPAIVDTVGVQFLPGFKN